MSRRRVPLITLLAAVLAAAALVGWPTPDVRRLERERDGDVQLRDELATREQRCARERINAWFQDVVDLFRDGRYVRSLTGYRDLLRATERAPGCFEVRDTAILALKTQLLLLSQQLHTANQRLAELNARANRFMTGGGPNIDRAELVRALEAADSRVLRDQLDNLVFALGPCMLPYRRSKPWPDELELEPLAAHLPPTTIRGHDWTSLATTTVRELERIHRYRLALAESEPDRDAARRPTEPWYLGLTERGRRNTATHRR